MNLEMQQEVGKAPLEGRYLAYCRINDWTGLVDVYWDNTKWQVCSNGRRLKGAVLWYMEMPTINGYSVYSIELDYFMNLLRKVDK